MKKYLLCLPFLALFWSPTTASANALRFCAQVQQSAVSFRGDECKVFSTPCDVPTNWKKVPSCDLIKIPPKTSMEKRLEERTRRVRSGFGSSIQRRESSKRGSNGISDSFRQRQTFRASSLYQSKKQDTNKSGFTDRKTAKRIKYNSRWRRYGKKNPDELTETAQKNRANIGSARRRLAGALRKDRSEGELSNAPKFSTLSDLRRKKGMIGSQRYWRSYRHVKRKKTPKPINLAERIKLRRVFRDSNVGNLDGEKVSD